VPPGFWLPRPPHSQRQAGERAATAADAALVAIPAARGPRGGAILALVAGPRLVVLGEAIPALVAGPGLVVLGTSAIPR